MPYFENCGAKLYYEEQGEGTPLLFLHGASLDMRQWSHQISYFASKYWVITLDARGHGKSSLPPGEVDPDVFWRDVEALMNHLKIPRAVICGLSMGGHVAIQTVIHIPERVERIILIGAICTNRFNLYERICLPVNRFCLRLMPMSWLAWCMAPMYGKYNPEMKAYIKDVVGGMNHSAFNRVWKAVTSMESRSGLKDIRCPALILVGDHDNLTRRQQEYIHKSINASRLVVIENAYHGSNLDNPIQVEREIDVFLEDIC